MEKQRTAKNIVIGVLLACVLCLSVAFAAFTQVLKITGTAKVTSATTNWNVKFTGVDTTATSGYATASADTISGSTETITFTCSVKAPGDVCTLKGTVTNLGSIKAKYTNASLTVTGGSGTTSGNTYTDDDVTIELTPLTTNTVLDANGTGSVSLTVTANDDATLETETTYTITASITFEQADA